MTNVTQNIKIVFRGEENIAGKGEQLVTCDDQGERPRHTVHKLFRR